jgi:DNA-binding transcriptional MerR regulator
VHTDAVDDLPRDELLAATPEIAARLAGVTVRQVNYWREIGLVEPAVTRRLSARNEVRLYDFTGLVEFKPTFAGTGIPVSALEAFLLAGASDEDILAAYPQLTAADIAVVRDGHSAAC